MERLVYTCKHCDKVHEGLPAIAFDAPALYRAIPESEREDRASLTSEFCVVDDEHYFVRSQLVIPVIGHSETLLWGVWSTLSRRDFARLVSVFDDDDQVRLGPMVSYFANQLPGFADTLNLKTTIHPESRRQRPRVVFDLDSGHEIALAQRQGLTAARAIELAALVLHKH